MNASVLTPAEIAALHADPLTPSAVVFARVLASHEELRAACERKNALLRRFLSKTGDVGGGALADVLIAAHEEIEQP